jgi:hypothetical protein
MLKQPIRLANREERLHTFAPKETVAREDLYGEVIWGALPYPAASPTPTTEDRPHGGARREIDRSDKFPVAWPDGPSVAEQALG